MRGAFSLVIASGKNKLIAARDPNGFRPLCIGQNETGCAVASESCAFDACGFEFVRDVLPGEVVIIEKGKITHQGVKLEKKDVDKLRGYIVGEAAGKKVEKRKSQPHDEVVFSIKNLNYRKFLKNISFELKKGEILGIGGLAGQGQVELILALAGAYPDILCKAESMGKKINLNKPISAVSNNILLIPGDREQEGLFLQHSIYNNLIFPKLTLKHEPFFTKNKKYRGESEKVIETLSIKAESIDAQVNTLSGGNQQKVVVGKWLFFNTLVMLLVDPAKGVDIGAKTELYEYILRQADKGMSVILYASDNEELVSYCDRILVMHEGEIAGEIAGENISEDALVAASMRIKEMGRVGRE
jgi:ribose transport system ATP-binding protein